LQACCRHGGVLLVLLRLAGEVNVAQVQKAVDDYINATHIEPQGPKPERRRNSANI